MEGEKSHVSHVSSPMDEVFAWSATPQCIYKRAEVLKRKCDDDSGYSSSPSCSNSRSRYITTPDESSGFGSVGETDSMCTPLIRTNAFRFKRKAERSTINNEKCLTYSAGPVIGEVDSYSEFMLEASLYSEPMELANEATPLCNISEEVPPSCNLDEIEMSKEIEIDISKVVTPSSANYSSNWEIITPETPVKSMSSIESPLKSRCLTDSPRKSRDIVTLPKLPTPRPRSLVGFEKIDILFQLGERSNYPGIISKIFSYLSDNDISNITMVSRTWKNICLSDTKTRRRWLRYTNDRKERKENLVSSGGKSKRSSTPLTNRNHSTPLHTRQPSSPPISPSKLRFHLFQKEARKLKPDEKLMQCPRCSLPSTCSPTLNLGQCVRIGCQLKFCTVCRSEYHNPKPCFVYMTPNNVKKRGTTIGSKESRRFLRRL